VLLFFKIGFHKLFVQIWLRTTILLIYYRHEPRCLASLLVFEQGRAWEVNFGGS
jgi:hypothetical protein